MKDFFFLSVRDIVKYEVQFNGRRTILIEYFVGSLLGIPLTLFAFIEWRHFSAALPLLIFFMSYTVNCLTLFLVALASEEHKKLKGKPKHILFHLWRVYVLLTFLVLCPVVMPVAAFIEYFFCG